MHDDEQLGLHVRTSAHRYEACSWWGTTVSLLAAEPNQIVQRYKEMQGSGLTRAMLKIGLEAGGASEI